jgi:FtsP/CotA-like multicopper oxidase with cupredoxin domain
MSDGTGTLPLAFSCDVTHADPATPGFVTSTKAAELHALPDTHPDWIRSLQTFNREFRTTDLRMPDGREIEFWVFTDDSNRGVFPSLPIRVTEKDLVQVRMKARKNVHTIHHHGIEPDAFNDGVGHTSFEAGEYTYQWRAHHAGTYFYHCHVNTTLHVQMGLFGALIIDPPPDSGVPSGMKRLFDHPAAPVYEYPANERIWAVSAVDPRWHEFDHAAGLCGEDVGLNDFQPKYFLINGSAQERGLITPTDPPEAPRPPITSSDVAVTAREGEPILIRVIQANYFPIQIIFGEDNAPLTAEIWGSDGRGVLSETDYTGLNHTPQHVFGTANRFLMSPAERYDFVLNTERNPIPRRDTPYPVRIIYRHWLSGANCNLGVREVGIAQTTITIL